MSGTAEIHPDATLTPTKMELIRAWLPKQKWFVGDAAQAERIGSFRFVDPWGEISMQTYIIKVGEMTYQVPITYRGEPVEDAADYLIGELEHSVLGHRYLYDASGDPDYFEELIRVIREADTEAALSTGQTPTAHAQGSGVPAVSNQSGQVRMHHVLAPVDIDTSMATGTLIGTWTDNGEEKTGVLACLY